MSSARCALIQSWSAPNLSSGLQGQSGAELRLSAGTFEENDHVAGYSKRHGAAKVLFHERQRKINPGRHAGRGPYSTVAHEDGIGLDAHGGKALSQPGAVLPVGHRATSVQ